MSRNLDNSVEALLEAQLPESAWHMKLRIWLRKLFLSVAIVGGAMGALTLSWHTSTLYNSQVQERFDNDPVRLSAFIQMRSSKVPSELADLMATLIYKTAKENNVPPELVIAIIEKESLFNPFAVSSVGAQGLMQVLSGNKPIDKSKAHSIEYNLNTGTGILREKLTAAKGDLNRALELYSGGAGGYAEGVLICMGRYILYKQSKEERGADEQQ